MTGFLDTWTLKEAHRLSRALRRLIPQLARPKMRAVDKAMVLRLVEENAKKRFELFYGYDPSPPPVKGGKGGKGGKGKRQGVQGGAREGKGKEEALRGGEEAEAVQGQEAAREAGRGASESKESREGKEGRESKEDKRRRRAAKLAARGAAVQVDGNTAAAGNSKVYEQGDAVVVAPTDGEGRPSAGPRIDESPKEKHGDGEVSEQLHSHGSEAVSGPTVSTACTDSNIAQPAKEKPKQKAQPTAKTGPAPVQSTDTSAELPLVPLPIPNDEPTIDTSAQSTNEQDPTSDSLSEVAERIASTSLTIPSSAHSTPTTNPATPAAEPLSPRGAYFIRASQGHSIALASTSHLYRITFSPLAPSSPPDAPRTISPADRARAGLMVHGTRSELYPLIVASGLSRMGRQHIHLAPALEVGGDTDNVIAPRNGSTLLIYLDLDKMLQAGLEVYVSANGVVLTPGDEQGCVGREMWNKVERVRGGERRVVWDAERGEVE